MGDEGRNRAMIAMAALLEMDGGGEMFAGLFGAPPEAVDGMHVDDGQELGMSACGASSVGPVFGSLAKAETAAADDGCLRELGIGKPCVECLRVLRARAHDTEPAR